MRVCFLRRLRRTDGLEDAMLQSTQGKAAAIVLLVAVALLSPSKSWTTEALLSFGVVNVLAAAPGTGVIRLLAIAVTVLGLLTPSPEFVLWMSVCVCAFWGRHFCWRGPWPCNGGRTVALSIGRTH